MGNQEIDGLLGDAVEAGAVPGAVAMAADRDGVLYEGVAGKLSVDGDAEARLDTVMWLASMTKPITSVAALQLVAEGRLSLEQTVDSLRPEFGNLQVLEGFDGDEPRFRPPAGRATVRQLITHTSGVGYWITNPDIARFHEVTGVPNVISGSIDALIGVPMAADPGTRWEYGSNTDWLGLVVEAVSGRPLDQYLAEFVLGPLGMTDTTFVPGDEQRERGMAMHARTPAGGLAAIAFALPTEPDWWAGGHGLYSTAGDYLRFQRALLRGGELGGERVLSEDMVELMFTNQIGDISPPTSIPTGAPELTNAIELGDEPGQGWGTGLRLVTDDVPGMRRAGTGDWFGLCNGYLWIDRTSGVTGVLLTQLLPFWDAKVVELAQGFEAATYADAGVTA